MAVNDYKVGYKADYHKTFYVYPTVVYTYPTFQPPIINQITAHGGSWYNFTDRYISDDVARWEFDLSDCTFESVTAVGADITYNLYTSNNPPKLRVQISNPTTPNVTITLNTVGKTATLYVGGAQGGETQGTWRASWPDKGTIKYTNKYNVQTTLNVSSFNLGTSYNSGSSHLNYYIEDVLENTNIICTGIGVNIIDGYGRTSSDYTNIRFGTSSNYNSYPVDTSTTVTYTFTGVERGTTYIIRSER